MKPYTIKLSALNMTYFAGWVKLALEDLADDEFLLAKMAIVQLYKRKLEKFEYPEKCSIRITLVEALALCKWLDGIDPIDPREQVALTDVFEMIYKPMNEQLCRILRSQRVPQTLPGGTTS